MIRLYTLMALVTALSAVLGSPLQSSSVYLRRGPPPVEYVSYEVPAAAAAGYNVGPTLYANYQPCVAPCVIEAPAAPTPAGKTEIVEAKSADPNLVILPGNAPSSSYDYAYVIYNGAGGQQQIPTKDIVSTQFDYRPYYGQEIVYTTDILNGYNTYFRNYVPQTQGGVGVKAQRGHGGYYVAQPGNAIAYSGGASNTLTPTTPPSEKPSSETKVEEPKTETEEPKQEVEEVKTLEETEAKEEKEPELLEDSVEMSTEEMPGGDDDLKYILTFEDLIKCSQAAVEGNHQNNHKGHNHNKPSADEDKNPEHSGHESGSESPKENKENSEGTLAPGSSEKTSEIEVPEAVTQSPTKEMTSVEEKPKHHKKLPVTYIILPKIAATKPC